MIVSFHPQAENDPVNWDSRGVGYSEDYFQENWNLIRNLHPIIAGAGIPFRIDLTNEGTPDYWQPALLVYAQKLWNYYVEAFGKSDTLGFSIIPVPGRLDLVSVLYGPSEFGDHGLPEVFDIHFYDNNIPDFWNAFNRLSDQGYQATPWIIGEAFYNDAQEAAELRGMIDYAGQNVLYLLQWPLTRTSACRDIDVAVPLDFSNYQAFDF